MKGRRPRRLFVYGSLMRGEPNHAVLGAAPVFLGAARTAARYRLLDLGPYPALIDGGSHSITGELYAVDASTVRRLDHFEGHPTLYRRSTIELDSGAIALGYLAAEKLVASGSHAIIVCGDWRARTR